MNENAYLKKERKKMIMNIGKIGNSLFHSLNYVIKLNKQAECISQYLIPLFWIFHSQYIMFINRSRHEKTCSLLHVKAAIYNAYII